MERGTHLARPRPGPVRVHKAVDAELPVVRPRPEIPSVPQELASLLVHGIESLVHPVPDEASG